MIIREPFIAAPMTPGSRPARVRVPVWFQGVDGLILPEQTRALDKRRLVKHFRQVPDAVLVVREPDPD